jgi:hypothetical protein
MPFSFAFRFDLNGQMCETMYSAENQFRLRDAFNGNDVVFIIYHETQHGFNKGVVVRHSINFAKRKVTNMENGAEHMLVMS